MIYVSEVLTTPPEKFKNDLQKEVYSVLDKLAIPFKMVETDEIITMEDCAEVNKRLDMEMVKTLFLCNRQQTEFYLFITKGDKPFKSKNFSHALDIARVSFAPAELLKSMLGTDIGAATVFSSIIDSDNAVSIIIDKEVAECEYYGCSVGVTTGYIKIKTCDVLDKLLPYTKHTVRIIEVA